MDLADVLRAVRRFWFVALVVFVLTLGAGYAASSRSDVTFESTVVLSVAPNPSVQGSNDSVRYYLPVIVEQVGSSSFRDAIAEQVPDEMMNTIQAVWAENDFDTGIVRIHVSGSDRGAATFVADTAAVEVFDHYTPSETLTDAVAATRSALVIEIINEARPDSSSGRRPLLAIMLASNVLGVILAAGAAVVVQRSTQSLDPTTRLRSEVGIPVLADIPNIAELRAETLDLDQLIAAGTAPAVEAFQALRARLEVLLRRPGSTLAVTSWQRNDGRTTVTAALGLMLSAVGREVVVIDADLRHPQLHERLGEPLGAGLVELARFGPEHDLIAQTTHPGLSLVPAGIAERHPSEILSVALPEALDEIGTKAPEAAVLLDAPALRPTGEGSHWVQLPAETSTVLRAAKQVLLVVDAARTNIPDLAAAVDRLREDGVVVVGAVLNRHRRRLWRRR